MVCQGRGEGQSEMPADGDRVSFWSDENILEFSMAIVVQLGEYTKTTELHNLKG